MSNLTDIAKPGVEDKLTTPVVKDCAKDKKENPKKNKNNDFVFILFKF
jgi:hypothetical protein